MPKTQKVTIALLDDKLTLVGYKKVTKPGKEDIVVPDDCDLSTNNEYKWDPVDLAFIPLGHGFGKPERAPISNAQVMYEIASRMENPTQEIRDWCAWYEKNLSKQHEELNRKGS